MKEKLTALISQAIDTLKKDSILPTDVSPKITVDATRDKAHGDFASNIALMLAKPAAKKPRDLAQLICNVLTDATEIEKVEIAGPGFINFFLNEASSFSVIHTILQQGESFGLNQSGLGKTIQVEFISANPTGPLHVGHGRGAAYGSSVANLLEAVGYEVGREYYVNDAGRQMNILATSVWLRYLQLFQLELTFPGNAYLGDYVKDYAKELSASYDKRFLIPLADVYHNVAEDGIKDDKKLNDANKKINKDKKEKHIDALIANCKSLLGDDYQIIFQLALDNTLSDIQDDVSDFNINYKTWFSEKSLAADIEKVIKKLTDAGATYKKDGALWLKTTDYDDEKDRVIIRENGEGTYFASDIAYHANKFERYDQVINVWGADHHGYIARVKGALQALGIDPNRLIVKLVQFAHLYRNDVKVAMSTRSGSYVTLRQLREDVGNDAARFIYVTRKCDQHMDFDLEAAKKKAKENPVYYVQYAHARVCSVLKKLTEKGYSAWDKEVGINNLTLLKAEKEKGLISKLSRYPDHVTNSALQYDPHILTNYLRELASDFHKYYDADKTENLKVLVDDNKLRNARLTLSLSVQRVIANGLNIIGVSAPDRM